MIDRSNAGRRHGGQERLAHHRRLSAQPPVIFQRPAFLCGGRYGGELQVITDGMEFYLRAGSGCINVFPLTLTQAERKVILEAIRLFCSNM